MTMDEVCLPFTGKNGLYEIRLESIGGLGANLCGMMLGKMGLYQLGLNSASFSGYGSEKTGTPVKGYIRYCDPQKEIRVHAPIKNPQLLAVFHDALLKNEGIFEGCTSETKTVVNTSDEQYREKGFLCVPAWQIARETRSRINVVMLGAIAAAMGFVSAEDAEAACRDTLGKKYPEALASNLEGVRRGFAALREAEQKPRGCKASENQTDHSVKGGLEMPVGGINPWYGNTVISDLSASRQGYIPLFIKERCINCARCDAACPDMVFQFLPGEYKGKQMMVNCGLDYYHCKGCLRCVQVCPVDALVQAKEEEYPNKKWFLPNQRLLRAPDYYEKTGPDGYITSESDSTEKWIGEEAPL